MLRQEGSVTSSVSSVGETEGVLLFTQDGQVVPRTVTLQQRLVGDRDVGEVFQAGGMTRAPKWEGPVGDSESDGAVV